jgi:uncharacterized SAM-binding protein YcdF (DUF218 family)
MKKIRIFLFATGIFALINFFALALVSNIHQGHILLGMGAIAIIFYAYFFQKIPRKIHYTICAACLVPVIFAGFLAVYGKISNVDYSEDVVIVLGAGLRGDEVGGHLALRLDTAADYLSENTNAIVIVSGGLGAGRQITEAEAMERYLLRRGIAPERILQEDRSTSTYENLTFSHEILKNYFPEGYRAVVVTNDFHIYRATQQARNLGIDATPLGAPTPWHSFAANYLRGMLAVINFWLKPA